MRKRLLPVLLLLLIAVPGHTQEIPQPAEETIQQVVQENTEGAEIAEAAEAAAAPAPAAPVASTKMDLLDIKNMDIQDVLKLISLKSGVNIIATQSVAGRVSVYLKNIDARDALRHIAEAYGWAFNEESDIIKVMTAQEYEQRFGYPFGDKVETRIFKLIHAKPADILLTLKPMLTATGKTVADEKSNTLIIIDRGKKVEEIAALIERLDVPTETRIFELSYSRAEDMAGKVGEMLTSGVGRIKFDERSNKIAISDTPSKIEEISKVIQAFDQKDRAVHVEAKIMQVLLSDEFKLGIDWQAIVKEYHDLKMVGDFDIIGGSDKKGTVSVGELSQDNFQVLVEALQSMGDTDILSNPSITALNNKEAKILVGSSEPYVTSTTTTPASGPNTTAESVTFIDVGVKLFVTPTIHQDGFITMKIRPEVSSVTRTITSANNNVIPVVETSEAETTVVVKDGITIIIGGLIKEESIKNKKMVPILGRIPVVGFAFRNQSDLVRKTELVIFLKPTIITGAEDQFEERRASLP